MSIGKGREKLGSEKLIKSPTNWSPTSRHSSLETKSWVVSSDSACSSPRILQHHFTFPCSRWRLQLLRVQMDLSSEPFCSQWHRLAPRVVPVIIRFWSPIASAQRLWWITSQGDGTRVGFVLRLDDLHDENQRGLALKDKGQWDNGEIYSFLFNQCGVLRPCSMLLSKSYRECFA